MGSLEDRIASLSPRQREALLAKLAIVRRSENRDIPAITRRAQSSPCPLSFAQQRLWFLDRLIPERSLYTLPQALRLTGELNEHALRNSLNEMIRRHESLRTTFESQGGKPHQVIHPPTSGTLEVTDLSALPTERRESRIDELSTEEACHRFDLSQEPLLRVRLLHLDEQDHVLLITLHHIIADGWSIGVFNRELSLLYEAYVQNRRHTLPELAIQYADFSVWQRKWFSGDVLAEQLDYWKQRLNDAPLLQLPTDRPRPPSAYQSRRAPDASFIPQVV